MLNILQGSASPESMLLKVQRIYMPDFSFASQIMSHSVGAIYSLYIYI